MCVCVYVCASVSFVSCSLRPSSFCRRLCIVQQQQLRSLVPIVYRLYLCLPCTCPYLVARTRDDAPAPRFAGRFGLCGIAINLVLPSQRHLVDESSVPPIRILPWPVSLPRSGPASGQSIIFERVKLFKTRRHPQKTIP